MHACVCVRRLLVHAVVGSLPSVVFILARCREGQTCPLHSPWVHLWAAGKCSFFRNFHPIRVAPFLVSGVPGNDPLERSSHIFCFVCHSERLAYWKKPSLHLSFPMFILLRPFWREKIRAGTFCGSQGFRVLQYQHCKQRTPRVKFHQQQQVVHSGFRQGTVQLMPELQFNFPPDRTGGPCSVHRELGWGT